MIDPANIPLKWHVRFWLFFGAVCMATLYVLGTPAREPERLPPPAPADLAGYYRCRGVADDGSHYGGFVLIKQVGETYSVVWYMSNGGVRGIGIRDGATLTVASINVHDTAAILTVSRYRVEQADGRLRLVGQWAAIPGNDKLHAETLTHIGPLEE